MLLYLVRHAHADTEEENPQRPLSERGRAQVRALAAFFGNNHLLAPSHVWHSPLVRARETAGLLFRNLASEAALIETPGLLPEDDPLEMLARLAAVPPALNVAIVGHQPHLGALATLLMRGKPGPELFVLKKGAVLALERTMHVRRKTGLPRWRVCWHISPELLMAKPAATE